MLAQIIAQNTGVLISPQPDQEGNKLQRQKILTFIYPIYNHNWRNISTIYIYKTKLASNEIFSPSNKIRREVGRAKELLAPLYNTGVLISPLPDQERNKLQRQKILSFICPIYNHNWRNINTIYIHITRQASNEIFSPSNKIHREVGRAKELSAPL